MLLKLSFLGRSNFHIGLFILYIQIDIYDSFIHHSFYSFIKSFDNEVYIVNLSK